MAAITFPTGSDIAIEVNGQRLAVAQSYKARTTKESRYVEAFGSKEPVGAVDGRVKHLVELTRVCVSEAASAGDLLFETVTIAASKRVETAV